MRPLPAAPAGRFGPVGVWLKDRVDWCAAVGAAVLIAVQLAPGSWFRSTIASSGDLGGHWWWPRFLEGHAFGSGALSAWSGWTAAGLPLGWFYFPGPALLVAGADQLLGYDVAFKLVVVSGLLLMPVGAAVWVRGWGGDRVEAATAAAATVVLVVGTPSQRLIGGDIHSVVAGEFSYQLALALSMFALGALGGVVGRRSRGVVAAGLVAAALLCHVVASMLVVVGTVVLVVVRRSDPGVRRAVAAAGAGALIAGVWLVPVLARSGWATDIGPERFTNSWSGLFPSTYAWLLVFAAVGFVGGLVKRSGPSVAVATAAAVFAFAFVAAPAGHHLWNARLLGVWYTATAVLAGLGVVQAARWAAPLLPPLRGMRAAVLTVAVIGLVAWTASTGTTVRREARQSLAGFEAGPLWPELDRLLDRVAQLPPGRLAVENTPALVNYGSWRALDLIPVRSAGRVQVLDTLYAESSATTPYIYMNMSLISAEASHRVPGLELGTPDQFDRGVAQLRLLGVRYLLVSSDASAARADQQAGLARVDDLPSTKPAGLHWRLYELTGTQLVEALTTTPRVVAGGFGRAAAQWFLHGDLSTLPAASGPKDWPRTSDQTAAAPDARALAAAKVSDINATDTSIAFHVSRTGVPVIVKESAFPNWRVDGAQGPYRAGPNLMIVVPTRPDVVLRFGTTPIEWLGRASLLAGLALLVGLGARTVPPAPEPISAPVPAETRRAVPTRPAPRRRRSGRTR